VAGRQLKEIFRAFQSGDEVSFRRAAMSIIEEEESKHHVALARDLRKILTEPGRVQAPTLEVGSIPLDKDAGIPLAEYHEPNRRLADLVLRDEHERQIQSLIDEVRYWPELDKRRIPRRQKILFYGPPGCGKTSAAASIAGELELPLLIVRVDSVVSSLLGETSANLRKLFDYAADHPSVLLFDEFDSLGKARTDASEHGEIRRVVNAFLQLMDGFAGKSLVIAATNHEAALDPALWRRFDDVVEFPLPTVHQIRRIMRLRMQAVTKHGIDVDRAASKLRGLPYATAEAVVWDAVRRSIVEGRGAVEGSDVDHALSNALRRPWV
jgi:SpoVK/Ycf46/Vps4 family AAA+-type ATPase